MEIGQGGSTLRCHYQTFSNVWSQQYSKEVLKGISVSRRCGPEQAQNRAKFEHRAKLVEESVSPSVASPGRVQEMRSCFRGWRLRVNVIWTLMLLCPHLYSKIGDVWGHLSHPNKWEFCIFFLLTTAVFKKASILSL